MGFITLWERGWINFPAGEEGNSEREEKNPWKKRKNPWKKREILRLRREDNLEGEKDFSPQGVF